MEWSDSFVEIKEEPLDEKPLKIKLESELHLSNDEYFEGPSQETSCPTEIFVKAYYSPSRDDVLDLMQIKVEINENEETNGDPLTDNSPSDEQQTSLELASAAFPEKSSAFPTLDFLKLEREDHVAETNSIISRKDLKPNFTPIEVFPHEKINEEEAFGSALSNVSVVCKESCQYTREHSNTKLPLHSEHWSLESEFGSDLIDSKESENFFVCEYCAACFYHEPTLKNHLAEYHHENKLDSSEKAVCICVYCLARFNHRSSLNNHLATHHVKSTQSPIHFLSDSPVGFKAESPGSEVWNKLPCACIRCPARFSSDHLLKKHLLTHPDVGIFPCSRCPERFHSRNSQRHHFFDMHAQWKPFSCEVCPATFASECLLKMHLTTLHKSFQCVVCLVSFETEYRLRKHMSEIHPIEKPFSCERCKSRFQFSAELDVHAEIHHKEDQILEKEKPFLCEPCQLRFKSKKAITSHILAHPENRSFCCQQCPSKFLREAGLMTHLQTHIDKTPFPCPMCSSRFCNPSSVQSHLVGFHFGRKRRFSCKQCPALYNIFGKLKVHLLAHANESPFSCKGCLLQFDSWSCLKGHLLANADNSLFFYCTTCTIKFSCKESMTNHMKEQHSEETGLD